VSFGALAMAADIEGENVRVVSATWSRHSATDQESGCTRRDNSWFDRTETKLIARSVTV
jgi:hypothetical protein